MSMSSAHKALLGVMLVLTVGLWGCTQDRSAGPTAAKVRDLETRNAKLEEDYRASVAECQAVRKKLAYVEEQAAKWARQAEQLQVVTRERDRLRQQVSSTVSERNALQAHLQQFSRELQSLAGKADAAATGAPGQPVTSATAAPSPGSL
jgi:outer membrane murein-binding lipoprotein Lpp